ncbi:MAG: hypothetical protein ACLP3C_13385 [Mycobacterium sp.]|uniref:hypothetical protein n=1 Tax=Mycobacterium sp. TaxID=1785 RepID=UPI003F97E7A0
MRDIEVIEVIDSELGLMLAVRRTVREAEGRTPNTARIDELLAEHSEPPGQDLVAAQPVQCHHKGGPRSPKSEGEADHGGRVAF